MSDKTMHFGEFNPLEVLATAAVQRGDPPKVASSNGSTQTGTSEETIQDALNDCFNNDTVSSSQQISASASQDTLEAGTSENKDLKPLSIITSENGLKSQTDPNPYVIKMVTSNGNKVTTQSMMSLKDAKRIVIPSKDGTSKTVTVLKINKPPLNGKSSNAFSNDKPKGEEDEGYCSRSSLDSPGQCSRSDSEVCDQESPDLKSPVCIKEVTGLGIKHDHFTEPKSPKTPSKSLSSSTLNDSIIKGSKILIVGKDNVKTVSSAAFLERKQNNVFCKPADPVGKGAVLRTLLGEKLEEKESADISKDNIIERGHPHISESRASSLEDNVFCDDSPEISKSISEYQCLVTENVTCDNDSCEEQKISSEHVDINLNISVEKPCTEHVNFTTIQSPLSVSDNSTVNTSGSDTQSDSPSGRETFQHAFQSFLTTGKPSVTEVMVTTEEKTVVTPVVTSPKSTTQVPMSPSTVPHSNNVAVEEVIDVVGTDDISITESLKLASSNNTTSVTQTVLSTASPPRFTQTVQSKISNLTRTIPVLINTANGRKLANVPVSSLVSTSSWSQNPKSVTYLVMPEKSGPSLLLSANLAKPQALSSPRLQYIIQDNSTTSSAASLNILNVPRASFPSTTAKPSETWTLLTSVDPNPIVVGSNTPGNRTVPVLIKKPSTPSATVLQQNSVVSSKGPQSLIPKIITQSLGKSGNPTALLVNPNEVLNTNHFTVNKGESLLDVAQISKMTASKSVDKKGSLVSDNNISSQINELSSNKQGIEILHTADRSSVRNRNGRITPLHSIVSSPSDNSINIRITGNNVTELKSNEDQSKRVTKNIGRFGALSNSWNNGYHKSDSVPSFVGSSQSRSQVSSPVYDSSATSPTSSMEPWSPMSPLQIKSDSELDVESIGRSKGKILKAKSGISLKRKPRGSTSSTPDLTSIKDGLSGSRLHPLIDHDYCMFQEFSAEIQSSIIATTESKKKIEKYNQKAKAAKTTKDLLFKADKKLKKRKFAHRIDDIRKMRQEHLIKKLDNIETSTGVMSVLGKTKADKACSKKQAALDKKSTKRRDGRNYVKITGRFQDDFIYYATKNSRGRPRKYHDSTIPKQTSNPITTKKLTLGVTNEFDWYRDLSKTDKSTKFGIPDTVQINNADLKVDPNVNGIDDSLTLPVVSKGGHTPMHESEVADLVMQMTQDSYNTEQTVYPEVDSCVAQSETVTTCDTKAFSNIVTASDSLPTIQSSCSDNVTDTSGSSSVDTHVDLNDPTEQYRMLLNSLDEEDLHLLTEKITNSDLVKETIGKATEEIVSLPSTSIAQSTLNDTNDYSSLNAFLGPYNTEAGPSAAQNSNTSFDLDDINDNDLIQGDIGQMNTLLGDFGACKSVANDPLTNMDPKLSQTTMDSPCKSSMSLSMLFTESPIKSLDPCIKEEEPDKGNLFPSINLGSVSETIASTSYTQSLPLSSIMSSPVIDTVAPSQHPPELTVVSMYWNDLPGLMINGKQCVRLVDIHKQMLPSKDTGILKKRCQMMNLDIQNCSELERDFLIRYANAAKSKSCVVVDKEDAQALVSFYVNPRPRLSSGTRQSSGGTESRESSEDRWSELSQSTESNSREQTVDGNITPTPRTGGKGKSKPRNSSLSSERSATPTGGKGKGGGKSAQKRKQSPQSLLLPITPVNALEQPKPEESLGGNIDLDSPDSTNVKRSERTRNKKVNYAALNAGFYSDENSDMAQSADSSLNGSLSAESPKKPTNESKTVYKTASSLLNTVVLVKNSHNADNEMDEATKPKTENQYNFPEEIEIRRLRLRERKNGKLNDADKAKLRRLRDRLRSKVKNLKKKLDSFKKHNGYMTPNTILIKKVRPPVEEVSETEDTINEAIISEVKEESLLHAFNNVNSQETGLNGEQTSDLPTTEAETVNETIVENTVENVTIAESNKDNTNEEFNETSVEEVLKTNTVLVTKLPNRKVVFPVLHRSNQRGRVQVGNLHFHLYKNKDSSCIQCTTCSDFLSVRKFLKHLHHQNIADELCTVSIPQKLEMAILQPSEEQNYWWGEFEKRRDHLEACPVKITQKGRRESATNVKADKDMEVKSDAVNNNNTVISQGVDMAEKPSNSIVTPPELVSSTRHSSRVRKRKQLHPMESYIYNEKNNEPSSKRIKLDNKQTEAKIARNKNSRKSGEVHLNGITEL